MEEISEMSLTEHSLRIYYFRICLVIVEFSFIGVMTMKRRIRRKRAAQALASSSSELEVTNNSSVQ
jgi:hypothetical protein